MSDRYFPFGLVLAAAGAVVWALSKPGLARAAAPIRIECPRNLPSDTVAMRPRPDGWTQAAPAGYPLDERGVLTGAPDEQAYLIPDRPGEKRDSEKWSFYTPHGIEHWVYCKYGPVLLARRIPPDVKECTATEGRTSRVTVFQCR